jgi:L-rhamnose mutarotase
MLTALQDSGWRDYSLYLREDGLLVGVVETDDFTAGQEAMAKTDVNRRWQAEMAQFFPDLGDARPDQGMHVLDEVFHLGDQLQRIEQTGEGT